MDAQPPASEEEAKPGSELTARNFQDAAEFFRNDTVGGDVTLHTPAGERKMIYADFAASGRSLNSIEEFVRKEVLPMYANVHTDSTASGRLCGSLREEARAIVKQWLGCTHEEALIFTGSGATGAMDRFLGIMRRGGWSFGPEQDLKGQKDPHFVEGRWGEAECGLCGVRLLNETAYRAHAAGPKHLEKLAATKTPEKEHRRRRIVICLVCSTNHHSMLLPFRELAANPWGIAYDGLDVHFTYVGLHIHPQTMTLDFEHLAHILGLIESMRSRLRACNSPVEINVIAMLTAASNVTGTHLDVHKITKYLHSHSLLVCWDFAALAGHAKISFHDTDCDVGFFSPHKFLGGPQATGILVMKKRLFRNSVPAVPGGGSVFFVTHDSQDYLEVGEAREEAGTPDIIGCIRNGLLFRIHSFLPNSLVASAEYTLNEFFLKSWGNHSKIHLLGPLRLEDPNLKDHLHSRIGIISLIIRYGNSSENGGGLFLHHNYVATILNDIFGVQTRSSCACAGPLAQTLMGFTTDSSEKIRKVLMLTGLDSLRPGFCRVSCHFSLSWDEAELIAQAVTWVAEFGWLMLPYYNFDEKSGRWRHAVRKTRQRWLSELVMGRDESGTFRTMQKGEAQADVDTGPRKKAHQVTGAVATAGVAVQNELSAAIGVGRQGLKKVGERRAPAPVKEEPKSELQKMFEAKKSGKPAATGSQPQQEPQMTELQKKLAARRGGAPPEASAAAPSNADAKAKVPVKVSPASDEREVASPSSGAKSSDEGKLETASPPSDEKSSDGVETASPSPDPKSSDQEKRSSFPARDPRPTPDEGKFEGKPLSAAAQRGSAAPVDIPVSPKSTPTEESKPSDENEGPPADRQKNLAASAEAKPPTKAPEENGIEWRTFAQEPLGETASVLETAGKFADYARTTLPKRKLTDLVTAKMPSVCAEYLWFALPCDALDSLIRGAEREVLKETSVMFIADTRPGASKTARVDTAFFTPPKFDFQKADDIRKFEDPLPFVEPPTDSLPDMRGVDAYGCLDVWNLALDKLELKFKEERTAEDGPRREVLQPPVPRKLATIAAADVLPIAAAEEDEEIGRRPHGYLEIPRDLRRCVGSAIRDFGMIREGDRVLLGLSGGKDSLTLLHVLRDLQRRSPVKFDLGCATVDPMTPEYNPKGLVEYLATLGVPYHYLAEPIIDLARQKEPSSICAFCSRLKRGLLYRCMRENGYTTLALGQHLDDICESFMMSAFHNGNLNTMKAHYVIRKKDLRVCRPLIYAREKHTAAFAREFTLPVVTENCPGCFAAPQERLKMKIMLSNQENEHSHLFQNMLKALRPLMAIQEVQQGDEDDDIDVDHAMRAPPRDCSCSA